MEPNMILVGSDRAIRENYLANYHDEFDRSRDQDHLRAKCNVKNGIKNITKIVVKLQIMVQNEQCSMFGKTIF